MESENPLLKTKGLPLFEEIEPEHVEPALDYMLENNRMQIDTLVATKVQPTWENFMEPLEELNDNLEKMWSPVSHLNGVKDSEELRRAYEACLPKLTDYASEMGQNRRLFEKFSQLRQNKNFDKFEDARKQSINHELRDFRLSGIDLDEPSQVRYRAISTQLSELTNQFSQNVLDATDSWTIHVDDAADALVYLMKTYSGSDHVNVGYGEDLSIIELAEKIKTQVGFRGDITFDTSKPDGTPRKLMSSEKLVSLGWKPKISLDEGIASTYRWYVCQLGMPRK